jgi:transposase-like protein
LTPRQRRALAAHVSWQVAKLRAQGLSVREIAKRVARSPSQVDRLIKKAGRNMQRMSSGPKIPIPKRVIGRDGKSYPVDRPTVGVSRLV